MKKLVIVPIYETPVWMTDDPEDALKILEKNGGDTGLPDVSLGFVHFWNDKNDKGWRLLAVFDNDIGTLAHEATHLAIFILEACGVKEPIDGPHEALAHLVGWITDEYLRVMKPRKTKPKPQAEKV